MPNAKRVGLVPMAAKPYHAGHDGLVRIAAGECDEVQLFVSTADRKRPGEMPIFGSDMMKIWTLFIEPSLPSNVIVSYVNVPVQSVYEALEVGESRGDEGTVFVIYSDEEDILKYTDAHLSRSAPSLFERGQIELRGVCRYDTVNVSGTALRNMLSQCRAEEFIEFLPPAIRKDGMQIYDILSRNACEITPEKKRRKKITGESLLRHYIRLLSV